MTQYDVFPSYWKRIDGDKVTSIYVDKGELTTRYADGTMSIESVSAVAARHQWKEWVRKGFSRNDEPKEHLESIHCDGVDQKFSKLSP